MTRTAVIAGLGPGFCERFAWKLAREGYAVGMFARSEDYLESVEADLREAGHEALAVPTDITDADAVAAGFERVREELGPVEVLANTASTTTSGGGLDPDRFELMWRLYAHGALLCVNEALPDMRERGGTVLFFGAPPGAGDTAFDSAKRAARGLARSLANELGPEGIHVANVVIAGRILNPDVYDDVPEDEIDEEEFMDPEAVADVCFDLIEQDESTWTFELDLRPHVLTNAR